MIADCSQVLPPTREPTGDLFEDLMNTFDVTFVCYLDVDPNNLVRVLKKKFCA